MIVVGVASIGWTLLVWQWQDPITALYTKYQQHKLAASYSQHLVEYHAPRYATPTAVRPGKPVPLAAERKQVAKAAAAYRHALHEGEPVGRMIVPRFGLKAIVVNGTSHDDLTKGPGRELHTFMPGEGELVYVAGHRTTYLAPFAHIDSLRPGDRITFELPYATFVYEVDRPPDRDRRRPRGAEVPPPRSPRASGLSPPVLRHPPLHRVRQARPRHAARRPAVRAGADRPGRLARLRRRFRFAGEPLVLPRALSLRGGSSRLTRAEPPTWRGWPMAQTSVDIGCVPRPPRSVAADSERTVYSGK